MKRPVTIILSVIVLILSAVLLLTSGTWYPGLTPSQTASILVNDTKNGHRALKAASIFSDKMLNPLTEETKNFTELNSRNSFWVADFFVSNKTNATDQLLYQMYESDNIYARLIANIGLLAHSKHPVKNISDDSFIVQVAMLEYPPDIYSQQFWWANSYIELSVIALGKTHDMKMIPILQKVLSDTPSNPNSHVIKDFVNKSINEILDNQQ